MAPTDVRALVSVAGDGFQGAVDTQLAALGRERNVVVSVPTFLAGIELVSQSDLLLSMPQRLAHHYRRVVASRALPVPSPSFDVTLVWHARIDGSRAHTWFRALISKLGAQDSGQTRNDVVERDGSETTAVGKQDAIR